MSDKKGTSDLHLLLMSYYGGAFSEYSTNYYLLDKLDKDSVIYKLSVIESQLSREVNGNVVTPLPTSAPESYTIGNLGDNVQKICASNAKLTDPESIMGNLLLGHIYYLKSEPIKACKWLDKVNIDLAKLTNLETGEMAQDTQVARNFNQYCSIKKNVLQALISKDLNAIEKFINEKLLNVPAVSNIQGWYWLNVLFNSYFKLSHSKDSKVNFTTVHHSIKSNDLLLILTCVYFYDNFSQHLSDDFKAEFTQFFKKFVDVNIYKNTNLHFPSSHQTNYTLETMIYTISESFKQGISQYSYYDDIAKVTKEWDSLIDLDFFVDLVEFSVGKTYQSIKIFRSLIIVKILQFKRENLLTVDLSKNYNSLMEIIAITKNFKSFYDQSILKIQKKNISHTLIDEDHLLVLQTYTAFLEFMVNNLNVYQYGNVNASVLDKQSMRIDPSKFKSLQKFNGLLNANNLAFISEIKTSLHEAISTVENLTNLDLNDNSGLNGQNFLKNHLSSTKSLNIIISRAYHALISEKLFLLKIDTHQFKAFKRNEDSKLAVLDAFKKCLLLNNFSDLSYYLELVVFIMRFLSIEKYNNEIVSVLKSLLGLNLNYWKCWNLLLILANSNYGLLSEMSFDFIKKPTNDFGLNLVYTVELLMTNFLETSELLNNREQLKNFNILNELKNDLLELELTILKITDKKSGTESALSKLSELFELFHLLFKDYAEDDERQTATKPAAPRAGPSVDTSTIRDSVAASTKQSGLKIPRFKTFRRHKTMAKPTVSTIPQPSKKSSKLATNNFSSTKVFANKCLQKVWLFAADVYLKAGLFKDSESAIVEAENVGGVNEYTTYAFAKLLSGTNNVTSTKKLSAFNEFGRSIDIWEAESSTSSYVLSENWRAITGLAQLIMKECGYEDDIDVTGPSTQGSFVNDLEYIDDMTEDDDNDDDNEDATSFNDSMKSAYDDFGTMTLKTDNLSLDSEDGKFSGSIAKSSMFINEHDRQLAIMRVKLLIENNLVDNYYYHDNEKVWDCLHQVYYHIQDESKYLECLERAITIQGNRLVRDLKFLDQSFSYGL
ncbi:hypothetical protein DASC09_033010 [Saccharomycopsis crataegensis]|uniref:Cargo-transport protein YPP1 n=1 Tax=Saccharomycopsis crataegensis TaxID=43959 RepID=A0AAV5QMW8_9ASCO|nr:hypothetical protein DASC09_033010 [Saccharomycopsis crataegensis]